MTTSVTQLWPTPSWIASFTTPIASISPVKACENSARQSSPKTPKLDLKQNPTQTSTRPRISPKLAAFKSEWWPASSEYADSASASHLGGVDGR
jgi:hypothetical protein